MSKLADSNLLKSIKVGETELRNRFVFAPTTRFRATKEGIPTDAMLKYYDDRTHECGLVIVEATQFTKRTGFFYNTPSFVDSEIAQHWKPILEKVHENGAKISLQLWALGRAADPIATKELGSQFVGPSVTYMTEESEKVAKSINMELKEMSIEDIELVQNDFVKAAKVAVDLGFDFVEIHAANGYLIEQFIRDGINYRTDKYGGSIENRSRFLLELVDKLIAAIGAKKISMRISPYSKFQNAGGVDAPTHPIAQFGYILSELEKRAKAGDRLAYVSFVEPVIMGDVEATSGKIERNPHWVEEIWQGIVMRSGNYTKELDKMVTNVNYNDRTIIGAGRHFTSNPDLINRLKNGLKLTPYDRSRFYNAFSNDGYNTWGNYGVAELPRDSELALRVPKAL